MAQIFTKGTQVCVCLVRRYSILAHVALASEKFSLRSISDKDITLVYNIRKLQVPDVSSEQNLVSFRYISTSINSEMVVGSDVSSRSVLLQKLETALRDHQVQEVWDCYSDFKTLYGFPETSLMSKLLTELSYSSDPKWLRLSCDVVFHVRKKKPDLLQPKLLTSLCLSLARAQMPLRTSMILRLMITKESLPPVNTLGLIILHMVNTEIGMSLASNILVEICDRYQHFSSNTSTYTKQIKPDTMIFNLVLDACLRYGSSFKGQQIIELMAKVGVVADAHTINIIAQIHEVNCQRDELKKFKDHIDNVPGPYYCHYRQFYDSLLNLHFKFNDIDSACQLIMDMLNKYQNLTFSHDDRRRPQNPYLVPIGSRNLRIGIKLQILPQLLQKDPVLKMEGKQELIKYKNGKLVLSNKGLAKIITGYKRSGRINELSKLLSCIQKNGASVQKEFLCSSVLDACICVGWLETAHDILEDMESAGIPMGSSSYASLLKAYYKQNMFREAETLLKQIHKVGIFGNMSNEMIVSTSLALDEKSKLGSTAVALGGKSDLAESLFQEVGDEDKLVPSVVNEFNSSIYFFMKAKMIGDTLKAYRRMQDMKIHPTLSTFLTIIDGYSSLNMYREITIVWGEIKRKMDSGNLTINGDLYELLLLNFIRGGYFERVMEVIGQMNQNGMFADRWIYKREFLKHHKGLYRRLKASYAKNEVQSHRIEYVNAFRKWIGIH